MSLEINIKITADAEGVYSPFEASILRTLALQGTVGEAQPEQVAAVAAAKPAARRAPAKAKPAPAAEEPGEDAADEAEETPAPAKPAARKAKPSPTKAAVLEDDDDEPVEEPAAEEDDDVMGGDAAPTLEDAVAEATKLVEGGNVSKLKQALAAAGAKKVKELKGDQIAVFVEALAA